MLNKLWKKTKEVASLYTGTFIVVMLLNQLLFFGLCLNPVCLIAAMPHVLFITVIIGTWLNRKGNKPKVEVSSSRKYVDKHIEQVASRAKDDNVNYLPIDIAVKETQNFEKTNGVQNNTKLKFSPQSSAVKANQLKTKSPSKYIQNLSPNKKSELEKKFVQESSSLTQVPQPEYVNLDKRLSVRSKQKKDDLSLISEIKRRPDVETLVQEVCPSCSGNQFTKIGKTKNNIQRYLCKICGRRFQANTVNLDKNQHIRLLANDVRESIKQRHQINVKFKLRKKLLSTSINTDKTRSNSIVIKLNSEMYLDELGRDKRRTLSLIPLASSRFTLEHDIHNSYDPLAIRVLFDRVDIGFIIKADNSKSVDKFCFETFVLKQGLCLKWNGSKFIVFIQEQVHNDISNPLVKFGLKSIWHMSHIDNVVSILSQGIMSNINAYNKLSPVDISNKDVQTLRTRHEPLYGRCIHDYAPTYLSIKNPMLFAKKDISSNLCIFEIDPSVIEQTQSIFTDGNAASLNTKFFNKNQDINQLPWDVLNSDYWNDFDDGKRKKCAEVLIYPCIDKKYIKVVHCSNSTTKRMVEKNLNHTIEVKVTPSLFFLTKIDHVI